ncbi:unnamed protein product [Cuscuta epithymum]|uniref:FBD domain-containing protein n=1 Tax=Cuscuta epithymum TaxID=186058 RepID=A0AAV0F6X2_9ASTE|nr:unnamed protein product [Cuscuta epithymum]
MLIDNKYQHDIISNLHESLKQSILMCLPLKDAARTSVLSRKWKYSWTTLPHLKLDETLWQGSSIGEDDYVSITFLKSLFHAILCHKGPITKVTLSIPGMRIYSEIDWLLFTLSKNDVEELVLGVCSGEYRLPSSFFGCRKLKHMTLNSCLVHPPCGFTGFSELLSIEMLDVTICSKILASLISCCPLLEHLKLKISYTYDALEIYAPRLRSFEFLSVMESVCFKNTPLLEKVVICSDDLAVYNGHWNSSFEEFFSSLPMLRYLGLDYDFMKCVAGGGAPTRPSFAAAVHLNILFLGGISLEDLHEMLCVVFVIGISPNLQEIQINLADDIDDFASSEESSIVKLLGLKEYSYIKLDHLRIVTFLNFSGTRNQMGLAKFLLMRSPRLKKLLISSDANLSSERRFFILKELTRLQRSSPSAELIYD